MTEALSYRNQFIDLLCKSMDTFLHDRDLGQERIKTRQFMADLEQFFFYLKRIIVKLFFLLTYQGNQFINNGYTLRNLSKDQRTAYFVFLTIVLKVIPCMKYVVAFSS